MTESAAHAVAAGGSETARLYDKYGRQLYRYCLARLRSPEEAEDAVQNTFVRVHGALGRGATPRFEAAWLYKIAHNVCLTRVETRSRRAEHELPADLDELEVAAPESERETLLGLEAALASMPKNLRDAILLREWQGLSYAEIAESLDTTVPAVETLIFRARRHLASALRPARAALDVGTLYGAVRVLLARLRGGVGVFGPGKVAAGLAAAALGTAGATVGITDLEAHPPAHDPAPAVTVRGAVPTASTTRSPPPAASPRTRPTAAAARPRLAGATRKPAPVQPAPVAVATAPARPAAATTPSASTPTASAPAASTPSTAPTAPAAAPLAPTASTPVLTAPLPAVTTPSLSTATVSTPTLTVPTLTDLAPTPTLPVTVAAPTVTAPALP